jgi:hypothetical protein
MLVVPAKLQTFEFGPSIIFIKGEDKKIIGTKLKNRIF